MKTFTLLSLLLVLVSVACEARSQGIYTYEVSWPAKQLSGTFTLGFGAALNKIYISTEADGLFGNADGSQTAWTSADFTAEPNYASLSFFSQSGVGRYFDAYPSIMDKQFISWTDASQAWTALLEQGATDGISISIVPEPTSTALLLVALLVQIIRATVERSKSPNTSLASNSHRPCSFDDKMIFDCHNSRRESGSGGCDSALGR